MRFQNKEIKLSTLWYFLITAILITYFLPRDGKFKYQFYEGKPWRYEQLLAPSNFPIYKTDQEMYAEKDSATRSFNPYFRIEESTYDEEVKKLQDFYTQIKNDKKIPITYLQYIERRLSYIYEKGIIAVDDLEKLRKENRTEVNILQDNIAKRKNTDDFFTNKTAYEFIISGAPSYLKPEILSELQINDFLASNVAYDKVLSDKALNEQLSRLSPSKGMVQAGERIIDRGEIVSDKAYDILRSLKILHESKQVSNQQHWLILAGQFMIILFMVLCFWFYLVYFNPSILQKRKNILFILLCILFTIILTEISVRYELISIYILPYAIVPIVIRTFFDSHTAFFSFLFTVLICSMMSTYEFLLIQIVAGIVVLLSLRGLNQRSQLMTTAFFIFVAYSVTYLSVVLLQEGSFKKVEWTMFLYFGINFILLMFSYILIYMLEKTFGYVSPISLVELANISNPLLKKLSETTPGTFQHSLNVSILATEAAGIVNADSQLIRTGALYHDIGKMTNPIFFTENQSGFSPHSKLTYEQSAQIIISHVTEGVKMAEKANLPQAVIDFIRTHHGKGKTKYFYNSYINENPDKEVDEAIFTYPGPNPFSKETAILMMADSVEAASRSLKEYTVESITILVNKIIDSQIADGLMKDAPLTFRDVELIKNVFIDKLKTMYHSRISYPELKKTLQADSSMPLPAN